ncbi:MAG: type II toxin-antitoxin system RelE/ParE family toxin [Acidobacteriota bacterium]|nr:type II toxin-antitoxin system RelE/ParE family toxin [Acidobacteriota bacterium]
MKSYRILKDAERDLDEIFLYWAERTSLSVAERLIDAITERFWILGEHPEAGYACQDIARGMRCFPAGRYLVYYRKARRGVEILHVFHGARERKTVIEKLK